jgi:hypothetical protein
MSKGQRVTVRLYGGETAIRRVVQDKHEVVVVCAEEEYMTAKAEGREPSGLGFPLVDIVGLATEQAPA